MSVYVASHSILSPFGLGSATTFDALVQGNSAVVYNEDPELSPIPFFVSKIQDELIEPMKVDGITRLESMMMQTILDALKKFPEADLRNKDSLLILSTTKGNIDLLADTRPVQLGGFAKERSYLSSVAETLGKTFRCANTPIVVSNACISGGNALQLAKTFLDAGRYKNVVVCGGDVITEFVVSGFRSFHALSESRCKPFDDNRDGINLGEAAACMVLSSTPSEISLIGAATSNDANHISGPSRTGEGLYLAIGNAMKEANKEASDIRYISAHGTATAYNDEMESIAFDRRGLNEAFVNSFKAYVGHTLGAAGILESILAVSCLKENLVIESLGYDYHGVSRKIEIIEYTRKRMLKTILKTGSGFGGGNNALIFEKNQ
ncbi:beta-ketoacyl synthase [bacterium SCSIO 12741]|nr:beta-ketoacyl synthase [bacterium SCSIO 12741]